MIDEKTIAISVQQNLLCQFVEFTSLILKG